MPQFLSHLVPVNNDEIDLGTATTKRFRNLYFVPSASYASGNDILGRNTSTGAVTNLATTGTPGSTTFLRGDGQWTGAWQVTGTSTLTGATTIAGATNTLTMTNFGTTQFRTGGSANMTISQGTIATGNTGTLSIGGYGSGGVSITSNNSSADLTFTSQRYIVMSQADEFRFESTGAGVGAVRIEDIQSAPGTPATGYGYLYHLTDKLYWKDDAGVAHDLTDSGGDGTILGSTSATANLFVMTTSTANTVTGANTSLSYVTGSLNMDSTVSADLILDRANNTGYQSRVLYRTAGAGGWYTGTVPGDDDFHLYNMGTPAASAFTVDYTNNDLTFANFPITPSAAPDADYEVANKKYVDDNAGGGSPSGGLGRIQASDGAGNFTSFTDFIINSTGIDLDSPTSAFLTLDRNATTNDANILFYTAGSSNYAIGTGITGTNTDFEIYSSSFSGNVLVISETTGHIDVVNNLTAGQLLSDGLTAGRVTYATTNGQLTDTVAMGYNTGEGLYLRPSDTVTGRPALTLEDSGGTQRVLFEQKQAAANSAIALLMKNESGSNSIRINPSASATSYISTGGDFGFNATVPDNYMNTSATYYMGGATTGINSADRFFTMQGTTSATPVLNIENTTTVSGDIIGAVMFTRTAAQADAHRNVAAVMARTDGTSVTAGADLEFWVKGTSGPYKAMAIDGSNGGSVYIPYRIGIGADFDSSVPPAQLAVDYPSVTAPSLTWGATSGQIFRNENSEFAFGLYNAADYPLYIQGRTSGSGARNIVLQPVGGNVGIGTGSTNPAHKLDVAGHIRANDQMVVTGVATGETFFIGDDGTTNIFTIARTSDEGSNTITMSAYSASRFKFSGDVRAPSFFTRGTNLVQISHPAGAWVDDNGNPKTGAIEITLPSGVYSNATMMAMEVTIFDYAGGTTGESIKIHLGGYQYTSGQWANTFAQVIGSHSNKFFNVRFGNDGSSAKIWIGELTSTWHYPKVFVTNFVGGHSGADSTSWQDDWSVGFEATAFNTVDDTTVARTWVSHATWADTVDVNTSASSSLYNIVWHSGDTLYNASSSKLQVQPSTGNVTGAGTFTGTNFIDSSARRKKKNIAPVVCADFCDIDKVDIVKYRLRGSGKQRLQYGVIADDIVNLYPELVTYDEKGRIDGFDYRSLSMLHLKKTQRQAEKIKRLQKQVTDLTNALDKRIQRLERLHGRALN